MCGVHARAEEEKKKNKRKRESECIPGIHMSVHKQNVRGSSAGDVRAAIIFISQINSSLIESDAKRVGAHLLVVLQRYEIAKGLIGRVGGLIVTEFLEI